MHNEGSGAYFKINKTLSKVGEIFHRVPCRVDVESWWEECATCEVVKGSRTRARDPMEQYSVGSPLGRMAVEIASTFPVTKGKNKYAMVVSDSFSLWHTEPRGHCGC